MPISLDSLLGPMPEALNLRARRNELLASNIANADTPNYKARDIDFRAVMRNAGDEQLKLASTRPGHIATTTDNYGGIPLKYRVPAQPSMDGNTVDMQAEQAEFSKNSVMYQTTLEFLGRKFSGIKSTLRGE
ncbi:flagellar basal body rod protein FlgB [Thiohalobacter thiocyanaticus]|uniref:Flagellar basal body rod protein FlgB n=1 Tax=Thiohalobacter thiocyanaticus TaxID=585455 RepID=A0A426QGR6_9GAMM|nr:flagellar basal body rod protein FlgB [Thiohalobacter thiocyanaticus]RRQ20944.1 flagellar basal body rod protein FlgB [Thiohalobacter thiocyanaticus]